MEDPRISRMYAAILGRKLSSLHAKAWRAAVMRSGMLTALILIIFLGGLIFFIRERGKGHLHRLETELQSKDAPPPPLVPAPGGQDAVVMTRSLTPAGSLPEFMAVTLLPGRGMNVLQIKAMIPALGEVSLLASPTLEVASQQLSGTGNDSQGHESLGLGGAFELPWAGSVGGVPTPDGQSVMAVWQGQTLVLPASPREQNMAQVALGGLFLKRQATKVETAVVPDGWETHSIYDAGSFEGRWLSQTEITNQVLINGRVLELGVTAKNVGSIPEPMGIGWRPRFAIPTADANATLLRLPESMRLEMRPSGVGAGLPTGKLVPVAGTEYDFTKPGGIKIGKKDLNASFVQLKQGMMDRGPVAELRYENSKFGIRLTALTSSIKEIHVASQEGSSVVIIDPQSSYDDSLGKQWPKGEETGLVVLQPGQSVEWRIRLELFPLTTPSGTHF